MNTINKKTGVLLLNLGGPDSLEAVRPFLYNLFSDRDIIRLGPSFLQKPIAWLISTFRSKKTIEMYKQIGNKSPILELTSAQAKALEKALNESSDLKLISSDSKSDFKVYIGMRYWHPFMKNSVAQIINDHISKLIVLSLYPHYSKATTGSSVNDFKLAIANANTDFHPSPLTEDKGGSVQDIEYINEWYDFPPYIDALAELIAEGISAYNEENFHLLFSAHSLPQSFIDEGDPYLDHINSTIEHVLKRLADNPYNFTDLQYQLSFQSKTGPVKWLEPSTEEAIEKLAKSECKNLFVVPVSFVSDHIETLYEIDILYRDLAASHGITLRRCKALNISDKFIEAMKQLVLDKVIEQGTRDQGS
ncbi:MAG: ferrochelatase [Nitrospiraceae bacterium]|nr:MAG: ferrochelatase [Nitrospiraceae bacterium]